MDLSLILFIIIVAFFAFSGYRSGFLVVLSRLISLPAAYIVTLLFSQSAGRWLQDVSPIQGLMSYAIAALLLFFATAGLLSLLFGLLRRVLSNSSEGHSFASSIGGSILGSLIGVIIGLMAVWFSSTIQSLIHVRQDKLVEAPGAFSHKVSQLAGSAVGSITRQLSGEDDIAQVTATLIANPAENIERINRINQQGDLAELFNSNAARAALSSRNAAALMDTPAYQKLLNHPDFKALAGELSGAEQGDDLGKLMAIKITTVWAQIDQVKNDPQFIQLTEDPEVAQMIRSANIYQMISSSKIEQLLQVIAQVKAPEVFFEPENIPAKTPLQDPLKVYRWVDKNGKVHYSDKPPEDPK